MLRTLLAACLLASSANAQGLTLREVQERARQNDPRVQVAAAQVQNAQAKRDEVSAMAWFPTIELTSYVGGPTPERRLVLGDSDPDMRDLTPGSKCALCGELGIQLHAELQAIFPIYTFGKLSAGKAAAGHLVGATEALLDRERNQASFDAARAYWGYQTARNAGTSVDKIRSRLEEAKKTADRLIKEESEQISKADRLKLDYLAEEIESMHASALKGRDLAITGMRILLGLKEGEPLPVANQDLPDPPAVPALDEMLRRAFEKRPEVRAAEEAVRARAAQVDLESARLFPDLGLVAGGVYTETTNASNPASPFIYNPYHSFGPYVAIGLRGSFEIPQKLARRRQAQADLSQAMALRRGAEQLVRLEVQQAIGDLQEARVKADRYGKQAAIGKQLATQAAVSFDSGLGDARELLEDTLLFARADGERLKALLDAQMAWASLEKAVGVPLADR